MEACAENNKQLIVLDRPNPNGFYVDGPILEPKAKSFSGIIPIPLVYGLTIGELATMINGEHWLKNGIQCQLVVIQCKGYSHSLHYVLPVKPSPNLPNMQAIYLYPSLGLFEGTKVNVGRGTDFPFQVFGNPRLTNATFTFKPDSNATVAEPLHKGQLCYGIDLRSYPVLVPGKSPFTLKWLIQAFQNYPDQKNFFNKYFYNLAGTATLRHQIEQGLSEDEIKKSWETDLNNYKLKRKKYLLYPDW
jgi:uncharacterized protein YbbC (DUF1343 family)